MRWKILVRDVFQITVPIPDPLCCQTYPGASCCRLQTHHVILTTKGTVRFLVLQKCNKRNCLTVRRNETSSCSGATSASAIADQSDSARTVRSKRGVWKNNKRHKTSYFRRKRNNRKEGTARLQHILCGSERQKYATSAITARSMLTTQSFGSFPEAACPLQAAFPVSRQVVHLLTCLLPGTGSHWQVSKQPHSSLLGPDWKR